MIAVSCKKTVQEKVVEPAVEQTEDLVETKEVLAIDILLDPNQIMLDISQDYNNRLRGNYPEGFELDESHRPHITVIQAYAYKEDLPIIEEEIKGIVQGMNLSDLELVANGLYYIPYSGMGLAGITIEKDVLMEFHDKIVNMMKSYIVANGEGSAFVQRPDGEPIMDATVSYVNKFVPNASGDKFNPHVTIGTAYEDFVKQIMEEPFKAFKFKVNSVSVYQLGELGTAQKKILTVPF